MIRYFILIPLLALGISSHSQQLSQVLFAYGQSPATFSFLTDQGIIVRISEDGKVTEWGMPLDNRRYNYIPGQLEQYMGRVDYFGTEADSISIGKIKSIGTCMFAYYGAHEQEHKRGKLRSVGAIQLDYFSHFDNIAYRGKLRSANNIQFNYYASYDDEAYRGNLKSVNNTPIVYFTSFDEKTLRGKIKTIANYSYGWYSDYNRRNFQPPGTIQGSQAQYINGITYILR